MFNGKLVLTRLALCPRLVLGFLLLALVTLPYSPPVQAADSAAGAAKCARYYVVSSGDRLTDLSAKFSVNTQALADANGLSIQSPLPRGLLLCLPHKPLERYYPNALLSASVSLNRITVWGSGFPKGHRFNIRMRTNLDAQSKKVATITINKQGQFQAHPRIPKEFLRARVFQVCLKDISYSYSICTKASR